MRRAPPSAGRDRDGVTCWRIALLTMADRADYVMDDDVGIAEFSRRGIVADEVPWTVELVEGWRAYDAVIVRTTWDYQHDVERFLGVLEGICGADGAGVPLANPLEVIRWNVHKSYLRELAGEGVLVVPTLWGSGLTGVELAALCEREGVLKPVVGAGAGDTFRVGPWLGEHDRASIVSRYRGRGGDREWMAQPFVRSVQGEGEYSLFWFGGRFSHAIVKRPRAGDFRVQEEHGGEILPIEAGPELRDAGEGVLAALRRVSEARGWSSEPEALLQARVDLVRLDDGALALMELELVEPSLYFRTDPAAPARFVDAVEGWLGCVRVGSGISRSA